MKSLSLILICFAFLGCVGGDDEGQNFGNIFDTEEGLILTQEEHPGGWGREDCLTCHPFSEIHQVDRTGQGTSLEPVREFVLEEGIESCVICHGDNGVGE